ncbi:MAG: NAD(+)/NADH kinase, partial [bacterium]
MKIALFANTQKPHIKQVSNSLIDWLLDHHIRIIISSHLSQFLERDNNKISLVKREDITTQSDVIITLGGDGTLLFAAKLVGSSQTPLLGVNVGGLGFLTEVSLDSLYKKLDDLISGNYSIHKRMT